MRKRIGVGILVAGLLWLVASWFTGGPGIFQWLVIIAGICLIVIKPKAKKHE